MSKRYVTLGNGRPVSLGVYVKAWKQCLKLSHRSWVGPGVSGWGETAGEALMALRAGLDDRINRNIPGYGKGRKWSDDWQRAMIQAGGLVNNPRLIIRWLPPDLMKIERFAKRVQEGRDVW